MQHIKKTLLTAVLCWASIAAHAAMPASLNVSDCWIRALPGDLPSGGYFKVTNAASQPVDLVGISSDAFAMAMLHQTQSQGSTSTMVMVHKVQVPAHGSLSFAPGSYHVMLEHPKQPLKIGSSLPLTFAFSDGEKIAVPCQVKSAGTMSH